MLTRQKATLLAFGVGTVALGVLGVRAFWLEPRRLVLREVALDIPGWHQEQEGLRVGILTDLHAGAPFIDLAKVRRVVAMTNAARPDLICVIGDIVIQGVKGGHFIPPEETADVLKDLRAPLGVFAVLGNHDWWLNAPRVAAALRGAGIAVLEDHAVKLTWRGRAFWLVGVSDFMEGPHNLRAALAGIEGPDPVLLMTHNPDLFPLVPSRVSLTVAGHTHGGQVDLPLLGRLIVPSRYGKRYAAGHVIEEGRHLFVATGIGTSIIPVRFRVTPEITILKLNASRAPAYRP